jgi:hypothetical protein
MVGRSLLSRVVRVETMPTTPTLPSLPTTISLPRALSLDCWQLMAMSALLAMLALIPPTARLSKLRPTTNLLFSSRYLAAEVPLSPPSKATYGQAIDFIFPGLMLFRTTP